jgi:hypothetical protein
MAGNVGYDPTALVTAVAALVAAGVAYRESRRNNNVMVKMRSCVFDRIESGTGIWGEFSIVLQNRGIPLHDVHVRVTFEGKLGWRVRHICLMQTPEEEELLGGEFGKGMIAEFAFYVGQMGRSRGAIVRELKDPIKQKARVEVWSQGFVAKTYEVGGRVDRLRGWWLRGVATIRDRWRKHMGGGESVRERNGHRYWWAEFWRPVVILPHLEGFLEYCREHEED